MNENVQASECSTAVHAVWKCNSVNTAEKNEFLGQSVLNLRPLTKVAQGFWTLRVDRVQRVCYSYVWSLRGNGWLEGGASYLRWRCLSVGVTPTVERCITTT